MPAFPLASFHNFTLKLCLIILALINLTDLQLFSYLKKYLTGKIPILAFFHEQFVVIIKLFCFMLFLIYSEI